jgi:phosphonate transport system substrate-binding protein
MIMIALVLVALAGGIYAYFYFTNQPPAPVDDSAALKGFLQDRQKYTTLQGYTDANGDLIADAPSDPTKFLEPKELYFTEVAGDDPVTLAQAWEPFRLHLEAKTGLKVKYLSELQADAAPMPNPLPKDPNERIPQEEDPQLGGPIPVKDVNQQVELLKSGQLHIAAFSTGQVPLAVNSAGFVPLFAPATAEGIYAYDLEIIVPAESPVKELKELKGKQLAFVSLSSNSGGRAPIVRLSEKAGLTVLKDYTYTLTGSHFISIFGVCKGREAAPILANRQATDEARKKALEKPGAKFEAACVASDLLARMVREGVIKTDEYRTIHREGPFPPLCFGVAHNLKPELLAKIKDAFATFKFEGNSVGEKYKSAARIKFVPVDYKKDWQAVRDIDEKLPKVANPQ